VDSWTSIAWQLPSDGVVCDPVATFEYNSGTSVWEVATWPGCETAPPNGEIVWLTPDVGPVEFTQNTYVAVAWSGHVRYRFTPEGVVVEHGTATSPVSVTLANCHCRWEA